MSDAPERVWVDVDDDYHGHGSMIGRVYSEDLGDVEYIRADIHAVEIARLRTELARVLDKAENSEAWWLDEYMDSKSIRAVLGAYNEAGQ